MKFAVRPIIDVEDVNDYHYTTQIDGVHGDALNCYFQLIDLEKNSERLGFNPPGLRYIPAVGSTLEVTVLNIDKEKTFRRFATNPFPGDTSIWTFSLLPTDPVSCTVTLKFKLTDGIGPTAVVRTCGGNGLLLMKNFESREDSRCDHDWDQDYVYGD